MSRRQQVRIPRAGRWLPPLGREFVSVEALSGVALVLAAGAALLWANIDTASYVDVWRTSLTLGIGDAVIALDLQHWVNDGLMTIFFFVVGLEIKREIVDGELRDPKYASLPVLAAIGGMVVPALLFTAVNAGGDGARGWGIPMATDIAFAMGVLALLGPRVPSALKLFLLTLAIVDDIGAILVIAVFYTSSVEGIWLIGAIGTVAIIVVMKRLGLSSPLLYVVPAVGLWVCTHESGIHATIAGVALGLLTPAARGAARGPLEHLEGRLHPWSSFVVVPIFALANAGVVLGGGALERAASSSIAWGIVLGLVVGKVIGIASFSALGVRLRISRLPSGMRMRNIVGAGMLAGIGFTVSLFIADLSFTGPTLDTAKVGVLAASLFAGLAGAGLLAITARAEAPSEDRRARR
jgi:NhaA family Na+:H+ antiporter